MLKDSLTMHRLSDYQDDQPLTHLAMHQNRMRKHYKFPRLLR